MSIEDAALGGELHDSPARAEPAAPRQSAIQPAMQPAMQAALQEAATVARLEERARVSAILNSEAARGRMAQAVVLATETALTVAEATRLLMVSPRETALEALASRAAGGLEIGAGSGAEPDTVRADRQVRVVDGWKRAVANANRRFEKP